MLLFNMAEATTDSAKEYPKDYKCPNCKRVFQTVVPAGMLSCPHCQQKILLSPLDKAARTLQNWLGTNNSDSSDRSETSGATTKLPELTREQRNALATHVDCQSCGAEYTVYEVFESCVACQQEQNHHIFTKNLELVTKQLELAQTITTELNRLLIENSLEDLVSSFDGFARRLTDKSKEKASKPDKVSYLSFQNLKKARKDVKQLFGFDLSTPLNQERWYSANDSFQKRHLLTHNLGLVDEVYIEKSKNKTATIGQRVVIEQAEVQDLIDDVSVLALHVLTRLELSEGHSPSQEEDSENNLAN